MNDIIDAIKDVKRDDLDFVIDGMVIKVDDIAKREVLGYTDKFPRWAMAFKFEAEEADTILLSVEWNVGRTGKLTPLAHLAPVVLGGATIKRATLNNYGDILRKGVKIGCRVFIRRSGDVIPEVLGVAGEIGLADREIEKPATCPACGATLFEEGANLFCSAADECPPQICGKIEHFVSKDCMDIEGLSEKTVASLCEVLGVRSPAQLYALTADDLSKIEGFKDKKTANVLAAIEKSKAADLPRFLAALGIRNVGKKLARELAKRYKSVDALAAVDVDELAVVPDIGGVTAKDITAFFANNRDLIEEFKRIGIDPKFEDTAREGYFKGKNVVLTGSLSAYTRSQAAKLIENAGGAVQSSVSRSTDVVVAGSDAGSKFKKATDAGIRIMDEGEFVRVLEG